MTNATRSLPKDGGAEELHEDPALRPRHKIEPKMAGQKAKIAKTVVSTQRKIANG